MTEILDGDAIIIIEFPHINRREALEQGTTLGEGGATSGLGGESGR